MAEDGWKVKVDFCYGFKINTEKLKIKKQIMKLSTITTFLFLAALLEGVSADDNSWGEWWDSIKQTFSNVTDAVTTTLACTKDWGDMLQADPALADASKAYEATYGYTDTNNVDGTTQEQIETTTMTYSADAMASYKAACEASTAGAVWWELPTGTTVSCATTDGSYTFDIAYENLGDCWPTTDACSAYATGAQAFLKSLGEDFGDDITCSVATADTDTPTTPANEAVTPPSTPSSDAAADDADATPPSMPPSDAAMATEEDSAPADESSASMVAVVTGAALAVTIVGTVMSL